MKQVAQKPGRIKTLKIDGRDVAGGENQVILDVAREHNIFIPTLCYIEGLSVSGGCRLCLVEITGIPKLVPSCTTRVEEGMEVFTDTERLRKYRMMMLELIFSERNHVCSVCVSNRNCELQSLARRLGMTHVRYPYRYPKLQVDASHNKFAIDHNRCTLCTRCSRICHDIEGAHTWSTMGRGINNRMITDLNQPWGETETCTSCGKCVNICPTGALFEKGKSVAEMVKKPKSLPYLLHTREES
ncbi:MAG TPA: bidirectional hydrogenase complex protein HoxU [Candidatus Aquicultor sp.]|jgi:bidirectional [NiFe] hydrogenase diaphorase subunit